MIRFIKKHQTSIFCLFNLLITFLSIVVLDADYIPQWMPGLSALILIWMVSRKKGIINSFTRIKPRPEAGKWYLISMIIPVIILSATYVTISLIELGEIVPVSLNGNICKYGLILILILIGSIGEEIGWRGFLLPNLLRKYNFLISSIITGIVWGLWHFRFDSGIASFLIYIVFAIETSIILAWLYGKTKGSIIPAIIYHATINMCGLLFFEELLTGTKQDFIQTLFFGACAVFSAVPCVLILRNKKLKI